MLDDVEQVKAKAKETAKQRNARLSIAISEVLASDSGRLVLGEILGFCQVDAINGQEGVASGRIEGARGVGLRTIEMLRKHNFTGWLKLYGELNHER